nr:hypothetical protein [Chlamydia abortus]
MVVGGLGLAGNASLGLLIFGGISPAVLGLVVATSCIRIKTMIGEVCVIQFNPVSFTYFKRKNNEVLELLHVDQNGRLAFPDDEAASDPVLVNAITELMELSFAVSMSSLRD